MKTTDDMTTMGDDFFGWFLPQGRLHECIISIPNEQAVHFNARLSAQIVRRITIGVSMDGSIIRIKEWEDGGYAVPKSGIIRDSRIPIFIQAKGVKLPARYRVEKIADHWDATLIPSEIVISPPKSTPKKPRTRGLANMLPKEEQR